jgi:hypothetical protein
MHLYRDLALEAGDLDDSNKRKWRRPSVHEANVGRDAAWVACLLVRRLKMTSLDAEHSRALAVVGGYVVAPSYDGLQLIRASHLSWGNPFDLLILTCQSDAQTGKSPWSL